MAEKAEGPIEAGKAAPAFTLKDQHGEKHRLSDYKGQWVVLYFYPKDNTPGCTTQACDFRDNQKPLKKAGAVVFGVSPDDEKSHNKFTDKYGLNFPLLIDPDQKVARKYGAWREKKLYGKTFMGIVRSTYLIDPQGKVAKHWDKVRANGHIEDVLEALSERA